MRRAREAMTVGCKPSMTLRPILGVAALLPRRAKRRRGAGAAASQLRAKKCLARYHVCKNKI